MKMQSTRSYKMTARAASADETRRRILDAAMTLLKSRFRSEIRLEDVAQVAGVTVQTVLNIFGTRAALLNRAFENFRGEIKAQRLRAEPGDIDGAIAALVDHYEQFGDLVVRNLAERADRQFIAIGQAGHRQWVQRQFAPQMEGLDAKRRRIRTDELICVCDVHAWKLLRRDIGRSRSETEATIRAMVAAIVSA